MTVALDGTPVHAGAGGIRRYTRELSAALEKEFPRDSFVLMSDVGADSLNVLERRWWTFGVHREMRRRGAQLFHGTDFAVPYVPLRPSVMTFLDCSPWKFPGAAARVRQRTALLLRMRIPTMVITPSEAVRREAIARFRLPPDRVAATPLAPAGHFHPARRDDATRYFFCCGPDNARKNIGVAQAAAKVIGAELIVSDGTLTDERLRDLYSNAVAVLYPSLYEGFGLPVLEAMACGAPVITSRDPALVETGGTAAVALDATDVRAWAEAMRAALDNYEWRAARAAASVARAAEFTWAATARATFAVYEEAIRRF